MPSASANISAKFIAQIEIGFELCEQVCGGVRRQVQELEQLLAPGETPVVTKA
jgi:hypothetical protein